MTTARKQLALSMTESEFEEFCRTQTELETSDHGLYRLRVGALYKNNPAMFKQTVEPGDDEYPAVLGSKSFTGRCVDGINFDIQHGFRTMSITHPECKESTAAKASLPHARLHDDETLAQYTTRVGDEELVKIVLKTTSSHKAIKAQSSAINALKHPLSADPSPSEQSQQAYRYLLNFDKSVTPRVDLLKELPGVDNVVSRRAAPP